MISYLPGKIANLEIDAARTDIPLDNLASTLNPTNHLCEQVSNLFPQLHYLRLYVDHLCPVLLNFVGGWPTWPISASAAQEQDRPTWDIRSVICWVVELPRQHARGPGYPKVFNKLRIFWKAGHFPLIRHLQVVLEIDMSCPGRRHNPYFHATDLIQPSQRVEF